MAASRVITLALLFSSLLFLVCGSASLLSESMLKTTIENGLRIEAPQERIEFRGLTSTAVDPYLTYISVEAVNVGEASYSTGDLRCFDLFLALLYLTGPDNFVRRSFRVPYRDDCSAGAAPCWRVSRILSVAGPNGSEVREVVNPSFWDSNEAAYIDLYVPADAGFRGVFVTLVTSSGQAAKPINLFSV
jgi:hypothetical protein